MSLVDDEKQDNYKRKIVIRNFWRILEKIIKPS
jgi:hypothetical protein